MMMQADEDESKRSEAVRRYRVLDTANEESFDRITRLAASLFLTPVAFISFVDIDRVWVKSLVGTDFLEANLTELFSAHTVKSYEVTVVENASADPRFAGSVLAIRPGEVKFFAGAPLITPDGYAIGTLSIFDQVARELFREEDARHLADLAALIVDQLELRRKTLLLQSKEADYRELFDNSPIGIYRTSPEGRIVMANPAVLKMLHYETIEELMELNLESQELVDSRGEWKKHLEREGALFNFETVWYTKHKRPLQICETTRVVRNKDGSIAYYEGWAEDISARKSLQAEREQAQLLNQKLITAVPDLIYIFDLEEGRSRFANRSYSKMIGQDPEFVRELVNPVEELVHPDDLLRLREHRQRFDLVADGEFLELEYRVRDAAGVYRLLSCRETVFSRTEGGSARELLGVIRDISSGHALEEQHRRDEDRWQLVLAANNDGLWDWSAETGETFRSYRWLDILGYDEAERDQIADWEDLLHPEDRDSVRAHLDAYLAGSIPAYQQEFRLCAKNGSYRWVFARAVAQWDHLGRAIRLVGSLSDITERKVAELALRLQTLALAEARDKAELAAEAKSTFLATMSHEIRTPLNGVLGMTALLLETKVDAEQQDYLQTIRFSGSALLTVINDILDFSKIEGGHVELDENDFSLSALVDESLELVAEQADRKGLELAAFIDHEVPVFYRGDCGRLRQVLLNLLSNAVKFTLHGEIVLSVGLVDSSNGGYVVRFSVADTGIGIPDEGHTRLFSAFTQADASTTRRFGGTGLGLAISKRLVNLMGGEIHVESKEGAGSTFWFTVRLGGPVHDQQQDSKICLDGACILVADDSRTILRSFRHALEPLGAEVLCANQATGALDLLLRVKMNGKQIKLAFIDYRMPGTDGLTLARAIRSQRRFNEMPIVLLSSISQRENLRDAKQMGIQGLLMKPLREKQLVELAANLIGSSTVQGKSSGSSPAMLETVRGHGARVLMAEDNLVNQKLGTLMLRKLGYEVDVVANGKLAVSAAQKFPYLAILIDCQMPEMDGFEATRRIRQYECGRRRTFILALTANALAGERDRCLAAGMDDYLSKPFTSNALAEKLSAGVRLCSDVVPEFVYEAWR